MQAVTNFGMGNTNEQQDSLGLGMADFSTTSQSSPASSIGSGTGQADSDVMSSPAMQLQEAQAGQHARPTATATATSTTSNNSSCADYAAHSLNNAAIVPLPTWSPMTAPQHPCSMTPHQYQQSNFGAQRSGLVSSTQQVAQSVSSAENAAVASLYAPHCGWAVPSSACSSTAYSHIGEDIVSQAADTMSEVRPVHTSLEQVVETMQNTQLTCCWALQAAVVTLGGLDDDLFMGLAWDDAISCLAPVAF